MIDVQQAQHLRWLTEHQWIRLRDGLAIRIPLLLLVSTLAAMGLGKATNIYLWKLFEHLIHFLAVM